MPCFLTDHFYFIQFCKPLLKEIFLQNNNAIQLVVWDEKIFKGFLLWLPWQPKFFIERNYLKEDHLRNIPVKFGKNQSIVSEEKFFKGRV